MQGLADNIGQSIANTMTNIMRSILNNFPEVTEEFLMLPAEIAEYTYWVGSVIHVETLMYVIATIVSYEIMMITIRIGLVVYKLLPFT